MAPDPQAGFTNSILVCVDCEEEFVFTASAQKYFAERGFLDPPKRCKACYTTFKNGGGDGSQEPPGPPPGIDEGARPQLRS
jgi:hypothetical protein